MAKSIYILLSRTGTGFSRLVGLCTRQEYTHVSLALDREMTRLYSFGRRSLHLPFLAGFVREDPDSGVFARYNTRCLVCELRVEEQIYRRVEGLIAAFCTEYPRYRYGFLGLPLVALQIPRSCRRRFVCSQFVAFLLSRSGALRLRKDYSLMRPQDFSALEEPRPFFRGSLREYLRQVRPASQRMGRRPGFYAAGASADGMPFSGPMPM